MVCPISCISQPILLYFRFDLYLQDGNFFANNYKSCGWTHVVLNYFNSSDGEGITVYFNGRKVASDTSKDVGSRSPGGGRIVVGRWYTDRDQDYASVQIDELIFFNNFLTLEEIMSLGPHSKYETQYNMKHNTIILKFNYI